MTKKVFIGCIFFITLVITVFFAGCAGVQTPPGNVSPMQPTPTMPLSGNSVLKIATTTSLYDTKLLDAVEDVYEKKYGVDLQITSQGTGKAIELAKRGDVDLLLVHSPSQEAAFIGEGNGLNHRCFAYNYFLIIGPATDPAGIKNLSPQAGFAKLATLGKNATPRVKFVSRGDNSGTHNAEKNIWNIAKFNYSADIQNSGLWYIEAGKGMGETLTLASEKGAYTLTDEGTYLTFKGQLNLTILIDMGDALLNRYSAIAVNPVKHPNVNINEANRFINWLISDEGKQFVGEFGKENYGKSLFTPLIGGDCSKEPFKCDCFTQAIAVTP